MAHRKAVLSKAEHDAIVAAKDSVQHAMVVNTNNDSEAYRKVLGSAIKKLGFKADDENRFGTIVLAAEDFEFDYEIDPES